MLKEFKEFIARGNVVDLAVGVIVGGAFGKIVTSLVNDVLMPIIGIIIGGIDLTSITINFRDSEILIGTFMQNVIDFLIVAFCVFVMVKFINRFSKMVKREEKKEEAKENAPVQVPEDIALLREINESLKKLNKPKKTAKASTKTK